jgi:hypothetical protein
MGLKHIVYSQYTLVTGTFFRGLFFEPRRWMIFWDFFLGEVQNQDVIACAWLRHGVPLDLQNQSHFAFTVYLARYMNLSLHNYVHICSMLTLNQVACWYICLRQIAKTWHSALQADCTGFNHQDKVSWPHHCNSLYHNIAKLLYSTRQMAFTIFSWGCCCLAVGITMVGPP